MHFVSRCCCLGHTFWIKNPTIKKKKNELKSCLDRQFSNSYFSAKKFNFVIQSPNLTFRNNRFSNKKLFKSGKVFSHLDVFF